MPRRPNPVPTYRLHKPTGQAVVTIRDQDGRRRDVYLGLYGSEASRAEYARILTTLRQRTPPAPSPGHISPPPPTVAEVLLAFIRFAEGYYRQPDGSQSSEFTEYKLAARAARGLFADLPAAEFGPRSLKLIRDGLVDSGLSRVQVNRRVGRIKRVFRWAASEEMIPATIYQALATVSGLAKGRTGARETEPVRPVDPADVAAVLPFVRPEVAGMIEVQRLTGMRPGEVCHLRPADLDTSGAVWLFRPQTHKNAWRGKSRIVAIGPTAQVVLKQFWPHDPGGFFFSPRRAVEALHAARSEARVTPLYPSHARRNAAKRTTTQARPPADGYTAGSYGRAVSRGIERANVVRVVVPDGFVGPPQPPIPHWHPNQLRHTHATEVRRRYGLEAAGASLGHSKLSATEVYAERDLGLALRVALELG